MKKIFFIVFQTLIATTALVIHTILYSLTIRYLSILFISGYFLFLAYFINFTSSQLLCFNEIVLYFFTSLFVVPVIEIIFLHKSYSKTPYFKIKEISHNNDIIFTLSYLITAIIYSIIFSSPLLIYNIIYFYNMNFSFFSIIYNLFKFVILLLFYFNVSLALIADGDVETLTICNGFKSDISKYISVFIINLNFSIVVVISMIDVGIAGFFNYFFNISYNSNYWFISRISPISFLNYKHEIFEYLNSSVIFGYKIKNDFIALTFYLIVTFIIYKLSLLKNIKKYYAYIEKKLK